MSAALQAWQKQLEEHFEQLARGRRADAPLFALEHPLDANQLKLLGRELKQALKGEIFSSKHWLAWVVYAAEQGYEFDGEEYWQSFSEKTPNWDVPGQWRRRGIRKWFKQFKKLYHGVEPDGAWAGQFTIIAWPITHAVLPKDLQYYFARGLWNARYQLAPKVASGDAEAIGRIIRSASEDASSRFQQFTQQESLVGRLAIALLDEAREQQDDLLSASTLARIVADLERTRNARQWLQETRRQIYRFRGVARPQIERPVPTAAPRPSAQSRPSITPNLLLRRSDADQWDVHADLPSFAPLATAYPELGAFLRNTRCTIQGGSGTWHPRGWLLTSGRMPVLRDWPAEGTPLVTFEQAHAGLQLILKMEGPVSKGTIWACKIGDDHMAREVLGRSLRCGHRYVLLHHGTLPAVKGVTLRPCRTTCNGIEASQLEVPSSISAEQIAAIEQLGLRVARSVRLWPAGLLPRRWDGEGHGEWLTTEQASFGLIHDSPVDTYIVTLNDGDEVFIKSSGIGQPSFAQLPFLPVGEHRLHVRAVRPVQSGPGKPQSAAGASEGVVHLTVREPSALTAGSTPHGGLAVAADPPYPDLDDLLNDLLTLTVQGPAGRSIAVSVSERTSSGEAPWTSKAKSWTLPVTIKDWDEIIDDDARVKLESASTAIISIRGEDLGEYHLRLQHDVAPLRWTCFTADGGRGVRLIDEAGLPTEPSVALMRFASPLVKELQDPRECRAGMAVPDHGGLYVVESSHGLQGLVVSVVRNQPMGLADLALRPQVDLPTSFAAIAGVLAGLESWSAARLLGHWAHHRRVQVVAALRTALIQFLCGNPWFPAERAYLNGDPTDEALMVLGDAVGREPNAISFAAAIRQGRLRRADATSADHLQSFVEMCRRFAICSEPQRCEFALRVASNPATLRKWAGPALDVLIEQAWKTKHLLRGARLAVLAVADPASKQKDPTWHW